MRNSKVLAIAAIATGTLISAAGARAQDRYWDDRDYRHDRRDLRNDSRDLDHDYDRVNRLRSDIARDQWRMNEDLRCGRYREADRQARDIERDQRKLDSQWRDIRRDHRDMYWDRRDMHRESRDYWRDR
ncbi:MAG: hypothetical protein U0Q18_18265 [Bryobacteraceae bacterium]